ncbi:hypothetical protein ACN27G_28960 [Plantactinospora sp. WMMB334]|uniref:hypothetical protein n=1 Tax=Plantactinospora sp. WMMB334 TaxID=3404119 RepID=UPI003B9418EA
MVRSLVTARSSLAHAAAGDLTGFYRLHDTTLELLDTVPDGPSPGWASYIDRVELDAITGRGLVVLADRIPIRRKQLLRDASQLLYSRAHTGPTEPPQRSALRHGAWLSLAQTAAGDLDQAVATARMTLDRLSVVTSVRSVELLHRLRETLTNEDRRSRAVQELLRDLQELRPGR